MTIYKVWDSILGSNVPLPELPESNGPPEWIFELLESRALVADCEWFHQWDLPDGNVWLYFGRQGAGYLLRFPGIADFLVSGDAKWVRCHPSPDVPVESIRHLFLDQVLPLVLSRPGKLVVHASAVASPEGAIAFLGRTGYGKSTLAAAFAKRGFAMMTDDCLLIEEHEGRLFAVPSYPGLRLWPETVSELFALPPALSPVAHYSRKKRVEGGGLRFGHERIPLARAYLLSDPESPEHLGSPRITGISARDVFMQLVQFAFLLDITDRTALAAKFHILSRAAGSSLFRRLSFPREFSLLPDVLEAVADDVRQTSGAACSLQ